MLRLDFCHIDRFGVGVEGTALSFLPRRAWIGDLAGNLNRKYKAETKGDLART